MQRAGLVAAVVSLTLLSGAIPSVAAEFGTAQEAKAMLERAVPEVKANEAAALAKFSKGEGGYKDRDLYVFCFNAGDGKLVSHPTQAMMGQDIRTLKDKSGKEFGKEMMAEAKEGQIAQVSYMFPKPGGTDPVPKETYVTKVGNLVCGVGYYK